MGRPSIGWFYLYGFLVRELHDGFICPSNMTSDELFISKKMLINSDTMSFNKMLSKIKPRPSHCYFAILYLLKILEKPFFNPNVA